MIDGMNLTCEKDSNGHTFAHDSKVQVDLLVAFRHAGVPV